MDIQEVFMKNTTEALIKTLETAAIHRQLIRVHGFQRGIGKTTALIKFAKQYDFCVVLKHKMVAKMFREEFEYHHIISEDEVANQRGKRAQKLVVDEGVDTKKLIDM